MKNLLSIAFMLACEICNAQQLPDYCVYLVKGTVTITRDNAKPVQVKQKDLIYKNELLVLGKNSEITLINKDDRLLVWNTAGAINVNDLAQKFTTSSPSVTKGYLNLAFHELLDPDYDYSNFKQHNVGGTKGGVSRGKECITLIFPVNDLKTSEDSIRFKWHGSSPLNDYTLVIYDSSSNEIIKTEAKDTQKTINIRDVLHGNKGKYHWLVKEKNQGCTAAPISFEIMTKENEEKLFPAMNTQNGNKNILSRLEIVDELEKEKWIYTAMKYYGAIVHDNPGNSPLAKSYVLFLLKYGFEDEAKKEWKGIQEKM